MNTIIKSSLLSFVVLMVLTIGLFAGANNASAQYAVPTCNSATLNGTVTPNGTATTAWFQWGPSGSLSYSTPNQVFTTNSNYNQTITGLQANSVYSYRAMASNANGTATGQTLSFTTSACTPDPAQVPAPTVTLTADNTSVSYNGNTTLRWNSTNATTCTAGNGTNGWAGSKETSGFFNTGFLISTTTYVITCSNSTGSANASVTVSVGSQPQQAQNPTVSLTADNTFVNYNGATTVRWTSNNATSCSASGGTNGWAGNKNTDGAFPTGILTGTTTYNITCSNGTGSANGTVTVSVGSQPQNQNPTNSNPIVSVSISADRNNVGFNESTIIRWYPSNAFSCSGQGGSNGWAGNRSNYSDSFNTGPLTSTTTYTISCQGYNGSYDSRSVTVNVGNQIFSTQNLSAVTQPATDITQSSAQLNGLVNNSSNSFFGLFGDSTTAWFEWGPSTNLGYRTSSTSLGSASSVRHTNFISGLSSGTTYYFRIVAQNSSGNRSEGSILSFVTNSRTVTIVNNPTVVRRANVGTALVTLSSTIDRTQPMATIDNQRPHPGDEINYILNYQNIGTAAITNLTLQVSLPPEVVYMYSTPVNPNIFGNNLTFNLGTLGANKQGTVTIHMRVREDARVGTILNFPATLSYIDPAGFPQSVSTNATAQVTGADVQTLTSAAFLSGVFPGNILGWLLLIIIILLVIALLRRFSSKVILRQGY